MIRFNNYSFYYKKKQPLFQDLNFELEKGKVYGLFGKNGSGKTTLLHSITGLNFPKEGQILVEGVQPKKRNPNYLNQIYFLPDNIAFPRVSINNYIEMYGSYYPKFSKTQFEECISQFEIPLDTKPYKMSFGQQKKLMIAFALSCNTPLLIMDEPTNGLDIPSKKQFRKIMASVVSEETIVVISTHSVRDLKDMFDHVLLIHEGDLTVNKSIYDISKKLSFNYYDSKPVDIPFLACEPLAGGYQTIEKNTNNEVSEFDIELFFNTAITRTEEIKTILNS